MKLFYHPSSPYVRKVLVLAHEVGLADRIECVPVTFTPVKPSSQVAAYNPLNKVPTLITDTGTALFDSRVICGYLDSIHPGPAMVPAKGDLRWKVLRCEALSDGMLDAAVLCRYERTVRPPEKQWSDWVGAQRNKAVQALDLLEREPEVLEGPVNLGQIALACALTWLEFRNPIGDIRENHECLFSWHEAFSGRESMRATVPRSPG